MHGGEAQPRDTGDLAIERILQWSADCQRLLVLARVPFAEDGYDDPTAESRPIVATHLPYKRDGADALAGKRTHLYCIDLAGGEPAALTEGDFEVSGGAWSPDGLQLAYWRNEGEGQRHVTQLWLADAQGTSAQRITQDFALVSGAVWSPDGRRLAFCGNRVSGDSLGRLYCVDVDGGTPHQLGGDELHLEGGQIRWHPSGDRIAALCNHRARFEIAIVQPDSGRYTRIERGLRQISTMTASDDGLALVSASLCWPDEAVFVRWDGSGERRLTTFNRGWMRERQRPRCSLRRFQVPDGQGGTEAIEAWLMRPPVEHPGPWPVLLDMHGGPQSVALLDFASHAYWYELAARGWMIVAANTAGSSGYGDEFAKRLQGRWGELDLPQHLAVLDRLQADGLVDERVACTGKSYGGFLAAWAVGRTKRFKAAVVSAPIANVESHAGTSDSGFYVTPYAMGGEIDDCPDRYRALSPVEYFAEVNAPVLLLNGKDDQRCPVGQVEELFARLVRQTGTPAQMVLYPGGSHSLAASGRPSHRCDYHRRIVDWVMTFAGGSSATAASATPEH
jgi:dipeptidyl aminopeptidase/acylaminoacyl peptidase